MNITSHESILVTLKNRASRYSNRGFTHGADDNLVSWALDETGTVDASFLCNNNENNEQIVLVEQQERNRVAELGVPEEVLRIHGVAPGSKRDGVIRLIYENVNGINNRLCNNDKVEKAKEIIDNLEVDIVAYNEHRLNMQDRHNVNGFSQLFKGGEAAIHSVVAHNVHENFGKVQEGGTSLMAIGPLTEFIEHDQAGKDETGLGRWSVMTFKGDRGRTRVICGYNPCYNSNPDSSTSYQQHRRFFVTRKKDLTCPRTKFWDDLVIQLQRWREDGDRLVVCLDANEDIYKKSLGKSLTDIDGLAMKEVVGEFIQITVGATYFWGSKPIDGIWATLDITVCNACIMPAGYGIGDHRLFVIDFASWDIVGDTAPKVVRPASQQLNTKIPHAAAEYARLLEEKIIQHQLIERIGKANSKCRSKSSLTWHLNKMNKELGQYMQFAEKKCHKFKSGRILFLPESSLWIRRTQVYRSVLKYHAGLVQNRGNLN
jgi:exonuclease III